MILSQMHLAVNLFCKKFKGIPLKNVQNIPNDFVIDIIKDNELLVSPKYLGISVLLRYYKADFF